MKHLGFPLEAARSVDKIAKPISKACGQVELAASGSLRALHALGRPPPTNRLRVLALGLRKANPSKMALVTGEHIQQLKNARLELGSAWMDGAGCECQLLIARCAMLKKNM